MSCSPCREVSERIGAAVQCWSLSVLVGRSIVGGSEENSAPIGATASSASKESSVLLQGTIFSPSAHSEDAVL